ncbi:hypothetical protein EDD18DRAFT_1416601, partial [Armillaria luteobubalina]
LRVTPLLSLGQHDCSEAAKLTLSSEGVGSHCRKVLKVQLEPFALLRTAFSGRRSIWDVSNHSMNGYLAIPAIKPVFSKSRHLCVDLCSSLKAETIRKALLSRV